MCSVKNWYLSIKVGRYKGITKEQRLGVFCDLGVVDNEFNFVFHVQ